MSTSEEHFREFRNNLVTWLRREIVGPAQDDPEEIKGEELDLRPNQLYAAGVLFPQKVRTELVDLAPVEDTEDTGSDPATDEDPEQPRIRRGEDRSGSAQVDDARPDEPLNLANQYSPSAMGITCRINGCSQLRVAVSFGTYERFDKEKENSRKGKARADGTLHPDTRMVPAWRRTPHLETLTVETDRFGSHDPVCLAGSHESLKLHVVVRRSPQEDDRVVSLMLVNHNVHSGDAPPDFSASFYQAEFRVSASGEQPVFRRIDRRNGAVLAAEQASMDLLYRHRQSFALGHGCAGDWRADDADPGAATMVRTATLPCHEIQPIRPREKPYRAERIELGLRSLCDGEGETAERRCASIAAGLRALADDYEHWIADTRRDSTDLSGPLGEAAGRHLDACDTCLVRMREGIEVLASDPQAMLAFRLSNRAMLMQQTHTNLRFRTLGSESHAIPDDYHEPEGEERRWRPFQLAFVLMNIAGSVNEEHDDRQTVDLIWFPTGGGKTEAYLGLAAFVICLQRLHGAPAFGTTVLMRYTLRLLTAQQFQRASTLILALEAIRRDRFMGADLGESPISIGLWVGKSLSPNRSADAVASVRQLQRGKGTNKLQVLQCPWCRVEFDNRQKLGYVVERRGLGGPKSVYFRCPDANCTWGTQGQRMPISVIDDDIFLHPPTLVLGTVDKFAQIAWVQGTGSLFGVGTEQPPPALIIQDELHLISGPLGSIVGLYETAIERLCTRDGHVPKIVASTATIRRAGDQCKALYNRAHFEFPPQGLRAGESYFAFEDGTAPGRLYLGVFASAVNSHATAQVRTCAALLQSVLCAEVPEGADASKLRDPFGTLVWYFNTLRELGHAATLCYGDIAEHFINISRRRDISKDVRRRIPEVVELNSRCTADKIPDILKQLEWPWGSQSPGRYPIDVLLATNMISVGVDVPRLGLMVVNGQPKATSEYIQATSRIGRRHPGLVVTVYNHAKSRDRSHYEQFVSYHQSIYRFVEPTSVTPFSSPARERGLRGVMVALARLSAGVRDPARVTEYLDAVRAETDFIVARVQDVDEEEHEDTEQELREALESWRAVSPPSYGVMGGAVTTPTLMYPFGGRKDPTFQGKSWPVMTSMRNVDGTCEAQVTLSYDTAGEDGEDE